jgi:hypothetical protein
MKVQYLDKELNMSKNRFRSYTDAEIINYLNKNDFDLGTGHDGIEWSTDGPDDILTLTPYVGHGEQVVVFKGINNMNFKEFIDNKNQLFTHFMTYFSEHYSNALYFFALKYFFLKGGILTDELKEMNPGEFMNKVELPTPTFLFLFNNISSAMINNPEIDKWEENIYNEIAESTIKEYQLFEKTGDMN